MKTTLPTLSEVVDKFEQQFLMINDDDILADIFIFNQFIQQILKLEMFIPCKDGVPLEEPKDKELDDFSSYKESNDWLERCGEYQQALDRVIFKGFEVQIQFHRVHGNYYLLQNDEGMYLYFYKNVPEWRNASGISIKQISDLCEKVDLVDKKYNELNLR